MLSFIVAAAMSTAPEMEAGIFNRRGRNNCCDPCCQPACCGAPAPCGGCGPAPCGTPGNPCAPAVPGTTPVPNPELKKMPDGAMPKDMPKGDKAVAPAPGAKTTPPAPGAKAEAPIEIPQNLKDAINKSDQKQQILDYLNNSSVPREKRIQYLETVRQTLLPNEKK